MIGSSWFDIPHLDNDDGSSSSDSETNGRSRITITVKVLSQTEYGAALLPVMYGWKEGRKVCIND